VAYDYIFPKSAVPKARRFFVRRRLPHPDRGSRNRITGEKRIFQHLSEPTFIEETLTVAQDDREIIGPGHRCEKKLNTANEYLRHLGNDVLPHSWIWCRPLAPKRIE
jgi:hypothetical protein